MYSSNSIFTIFSILSFFKDNILECYFQPLLFEQILRTSTYILCYDNISTGIILDNPHINSVPLLQTWCMPRRVTGSGGHGTVQRVSTRNNLSCLLSWRQTRVSIRTLENHPPKKVKVGIIYTKCNMSSYRTNYVSEHS